jgi:hypothetical protein
MPAVVKLIPRPPAFVVRRNMNFSLLGLLYSPIAMMRSSWAVLPSIRQYSIQCDSQRPRKNPRMFGIPYCIDGRDRRLRVYLRHETFEDGVFAFILFRSLSRITIFPALSIMCSSVGYGGPSSYKEGVQMCEKHRIGFQRTAPSHVAFQSWVRHD